MAEIRLYGEGTRGIQAPTPDEPYTHEIDVRPLKHLAENDYKINAELQSMVFKRPVEKPDGTRNVFTLPDNESAMPNTLMVFLNGVLYSPERIHLLNDGKQFKINDLVPSRGDDLTILYRIANTVLYSMVDLFFLPHISARYKGFLDGAGIKVPVVNKSFVVCFFDEPVLKDDGAGGIRLIGDNDPLLNFRGSINYETGEYDFVLKNSDYLDKTPSGIDGHEIESGYDSALKIIYQYYIR